MKIIVEMKVWHGDYKGVEVAAGDTIESALAEIMNTSMGIGYGPKVGTPQFSTVASMLEDYGIASWGWGNYKLMTT